MAAKPSRTPQAGYSARPRIDKLGVAAGDQVGVIGLDDPSFDAELAERGVTPVRGRVPKGADFAFLGVTRKSELKRLGALEGRIARDGAIWVVWPKGRPELREDDIRAAAIAVGLVDVKVIAFSAELSGLKLMIPKSRR